MDTRAGLLVLALFSLAYGSPIPAPAPAPPQQILDHGGLGLASHGGPCDPSANLGYGLAIGLPSLSSPCESSLGLAYPSLGLSYPAIGSNSLCDSSNLYGLHGLGGVGYGLSPSIIDAPSVGYLGGYGGLGLGGLGLGGLGYGSLYLPGGSTVCDSGLGLGLGNLGSGNLSPYGHMIPSGSPCDPSSSLGYGGLYGYGGLGVGVPFL